MEILKILVIQTAFIGDAVLTLPMIQELFRVHHSPVIDVLCIPASAEIFSSSPCVRNTLVYDKRGTDKGVTGMVKLAARLRKEKYDMIFSPHRSFRTSLLVLSSGVRNTTGFSTASLPFVYKNKVLYENKHHEVRRDLDLAGISTEGETWKILPVIETSPEKKLNVSRFLGRFPANTKYAVVAPGSVWATKKFPRDRYLQIIKYLNAGGYTVVLTGGKNDEYECREIEAEAGGAPSVISAAGMFTITETVELYRHCAIVVCNDSAPTHFAMCAGVSALTIYCSTVAEFGFYPYSKNSMWISYDDLECKPCGIHGHNECPIGTFECAYKLEMQNIYTAIDKLLSYNK